MKAPPSTRPKQQTPKEMLDGLKDFVARKFYEGDSVGFMKDEPRLLKWVLLYPAKWLNERGVTITTERYRALINGVLMEALRHGNTAQIGYRPAWLGKVIQSHLAFHGEKLYSEAKSARSLAENALLMVGRLSTNRQDDPVKTLVAASRLLERKKPMVKQTGKDQLNLL